MSVQPQDQHKLSDRSSIQAEVERALRSEPVVDMHTHLYPPGFGTPVPNKTGKTDPTGLLLWGIDELLTYHYLVAEVFRVVPASRLPYEQFWKMSKTQQADHIWKWLFVERAPISEACRGVLTCVQKLGLDPDDSPAQWRKYFAEQDPGKHIDRVMELSNVKSITMTNPVFDDNERNRWLKDPNVGADPRFKAVLRIDPLLRNWPAAAKKLTEWGYPASEKIDDKSIESARKFLRDWIDRQKAIYLAVSLPPSFRYPAPPTDTLGAAGSAIFSKVIMPVCAERNLPFAMMIGSILQVNPGLRDGGDAEGKADIESVMNICREFPTNRFFVTMLARENQHELCVAARKFGNLMVFGCWWFVNNPSLIEEITRMRCELLGPTFIPQHSDARVLDQLIYKWDHSRRIIAKVLTDKFDDLRLTGRIPTAGQVQRTVRDFFSGNFTRFLAGE
ncbi:MAG TPA: hypothetical protein VNL70_10135 [Tepidisphaeraceae bacterium]|nr:hypothetical protein [Tepidisphaeraceae bacterium]